MAKKDLAKEEDKIIAQKEKLQRDREKALAILNRVRAGDKALKEKRDKVRNHKLIQRGALIEIAGLIDINPYVIMGILLEANQAIQLHDKEKIAKWEEEGAKILALSKVDRKSIKEDNYQKIMACINYLSSLQAPEEAINLDAT